MGGGASAQKTSAACANHSEFATYREDYMKAKEAGLNNHDFFDKMSKARIALPDSKEPPKRQNRTSSHDRIPPQGGQTLGGKTLFKDDRRKSLFGDVSNDNDTKKLRRNQIFEDGFDFTLASARKGMAKLARGFDKTKEVFRDGNDKLILEALVNFFFMGDDNADQMNALIDTMQKETCPAGQWLMQEGEPGDTMYVIKTGKLEVFVGGRLTRHIGRGGAVGELALLYHTPRSASVKAVEDCVLFSLHRTKFREMLALSVSVSLVQRVAWMRAIPELEPLDKQAASRLAGAFNTIQLRQGETVAVEGSTVDRCFMVEFGTVEVTSSIVTSPDLIRKQLNAAVPKPDTARRSTGSDSQDLTGGGEGQGHREPLAEVSPRKSEPLGGRLAENEEVGSSEQSEDARRRQSKGLTFGPGTFFGMPVLLCAGKGTKGGCWEAAPDQGTPAEAKDAAVEGAGQARANPTAGEFSGAICPVTITANEDVRLSYFTPAQFETIVGPIRETFSQLVKGRPSLLKKTKSERFVRKALDCRFTTSDFKTEVFLGTGSFGRVTLVTFKDKAKQEEAGLADTEFFALKALAKKAVIDRGQLAHVKDEKLLLQNMNHPLILGLFSTFQDANSIFFLMEAVTAGEMWSIVYEATSGFPEGELPIEHGRFYAACVLEALSFMHSRGVAYRDLKPENIMVDGEGYPRLIDLGFAKKIPFTRVIDGKSEVHPKSFTMCGTPEYLAPEFIFNAGHDKAVDCWALGVLTFEFTAGYTPFQPPGEASDITALFTRIAGSKSTVGGAIFPSGFDKKAKNKHCRDIVSKFLNADPTERLGNLAGGLDEAKKHRYFAGIDWNGLAHKKMPAVAVGLRCGTVDPRNTFSDHEVAVDLRNSALADALRPAPNFTVDGWAWVYNSASTIRQGVKANTDAKVLKAKLALNWTGPYKVLAVGPCSAAETPDGSPLGSNLLYLDLPSDLPGSDARRRVAIERCKPCANPHDSGDMPKYLPAGLTQYVLNKFSKKSPPYHVTQDDVSTPLQRLEVEQITGHQSVRGRGGIIAVLYKTHWAGLSEPSWEREMDFHLSRSHILRYWTGTPDQHR
eukprot:jgi/Undpi1/4199/HiC_scaffold_16.g07566.m1